MGLGETEANCYLAFPLWDLPGWGGSPLNSSSGFDTGHTGLHMSTDMQWVRAFVAKTTSTNKLNSKVLMEMRVTRVFVHGEYPTVSTEAVLDTNSLLIRSRSACNTLISS